MPSRLRTLLTRRAPVDSFAEPGGSRWLSAIAHDTRFALRYFARQRATTAIIVAVLALGTGANTLIFSMFQAYFLRPAPAVPKDDTHARLWAQERATRSAAWEARGFTQPELTALAAHRELFRDVAAWTEDDVIVDAGDSTGARGVGAQFVTPNYFATLGITLAAGRGFRADAAGPGDEAPEMAAVMSYASAEQMYGDARGALGKPILVNELPVVIVGVAPPRFQGAVRNMNDAVLWMPLSARADVARVSPRWLADHAALALFARLTDGASRTRATVLARQVVAGALPDSAARVGMARTADVLSLQALPPGRESSELLLGITMITGIGVLILLVAWMNVSSLMVASAVGRRHEIATRLSLGASRARLLRQLVTESTLLALVGSGIGLTLAWWELTYMMKTEVGGVNLAPDPGTFAFVLAMAVASGVLFGLSPALHATRGSLASTLHASGSRAGGRSRLQRGFVVAQIALSQPLLVLLGTLLVLVLADYKPIASSTGRHVIAVGFRPLDSTGTVRQRADAVDSLVPRIAAQPNVIGAVPDAARFAERAVIAPDRQVPNASADTAPTMVALHGAAPGWLTLLGVPLALGRDVALGDSAAADHPVVIGSDLARVLWGGANPIGRTLVSPARGGAAPDSMTMTVVGVYDAARDADAHGSAGMAAAPSVSRVYTAYGKHWRHDRVLVRTRGPAAPWLPALQRIVRAEAPSLPVTSMLTLAQQDDAAYADTMRMTMMAAAGGALALLLASLGLYGVVSLAVRQRTREIGIRIAIGAPPVKVAREFLASGVRLGVAALGIGLPLSIAALRVGMAQGLVIAPGVNPYVIGIAIALVLLAVASAATWLPARRAARVDPAGSLRV